MKKLLTVIIVASIAAGCGSTAGSAQPGTSAVQTVPLYIPADTIGMLASAWRERTNQKVTMDYMAGDNLSGKLVDLSGIDTDSDIVSFTYRYNFGRGVREVYSDYEPVPALWFGAGFGTVGWDFIWHFTYDMSQVYAGCSLPFGEQATFDIQARLLSIDGWDVILQNYTDLRSTLTFYPADDMYIGIGYQFEQYENSMGDSNWSDPFFELGYLMGRDDNGVELLLSYRQKGRNGTDDEADYFGGGVKIHMGKAIALGISYDDVSGDLNESNSLDIGLWISPGAGVHIKLGITDTEIDSLSENQTNYNFGVSYAF